MVHQVTLFTKGPAPNPLKVAILLEELNIDYAVVDKEDGDSHNGVKAADFLKINPNGRVPAIIDHTNNDHIVWESGAILLYLAERFDPTGNFAGNTLQQRSEVWEWLFFQMSGLGPIQGQVNWFKHFHHVKDLDSSVSTRYINETYRVWNVLDNRLKDKGEWIALNKFTIVDMAIYPWLHIAYFGELDISKYPHLQAYSKKISELPSVKRAYAKIVPPQYR